MAVKTDKMELGQNAVYSGTVGVETDGTNLILKDATAGSKTLSDLVGGGGPTSINDLTDLDSDFATQYYNGSRLDSYVADPAKGDTVGVSGDVGGSTTLGGHVADAEIHQRVPKFVLRVAKSGQIYSSVQAAIDAVPTTGPDAASASQVYQIQISPGVYTEAVNLNKRYVQLVGSGSGCTKITSTNASQTLLISGNSHGALVRDLHLENSVGMGLKVDITGGSASGIKISDCVIHSTASPAAHFIDATNSCECYNVEFTTGGTADAVTTTTNSMSFRQCAFNVFDPSYVGLKVASTGTFKLAGCSSTAALLCLLGTAVVTVIGCISLYSAETVEKNSTNGTIRWDGIGYVQDYDPTGPPVIEPLQPVLQPTEQVFEVSPDGSRQYSTIQAALAAATDPNVRKVILLYPGVYQQSTVANTRIQVMVADTHIRSVGGPEATLIRGQSHKGLSTWAVLEIHASDCSVEGVHIINKTYVGSNPEDKSTALGVGSSTPADPSGGITVSNIVVRNCKFSAESTYASGLYMSWDVVCTGSNVDGVLFDNCVATAFADTVSIFGSRNIVWRGGEIYAARWDCLWVAGARNTDWPGDLPCTVRVENATLSCYLHGVSGGSWAFNPTVPEVTLSNVTLRQSWPANGSGVTVPEVARVGDTFIGLKVNVSATNYVPPFTYGVGTGVNNVTLNQQIYRGSGAQLTGLNASSIVTGTLPDARLSSNIPKKDAANIFSLLQTLSGGLSVGSPYTCVAGNNNIPLDKTLIAMTPGVGSQVLLFDTLNAPVGKLYIAWTQARDFSNTNTITLDVGSGNFVSSFGAYGQTWALTGTQSNQAFRWLIIFKDFSTRWSVISGYGA